MRMFYDMFKKAGAAGTWGPGANRVRLSVTHHTFPKTYLLQTFAEQLPSTHVKDVASAVFTVLKAALEDRAEEGKDGICELTTSRKSVEES